MKIALLADVHGNYVALEACIDYIDNNKFDGIAFLGDYITDCPYPKRVIEILKQAAKRNKTWFVRGNREDYIINHHKSQNDNWCYGSQTGSLLYTYENMTEEDILFFEKMPITSIVELDGCESFTICHGSPISTRETLCSKGRNSKNHLKNIDTAYLFSGHTHKPFQYNYKNKLLVNCGSVGMPINGQINAQFTQIEFVDNKWNISLISIPYDINSLIIDFQESGIYDKGFYWSKSIVKTIKTGINYSELCLQKANKIGRNKEILEKHWKLAAKELEI